MTSDRRSYTERVRDTAPVLNRDDFTGVLDAADTALAVAGVPDLLDELRDAEARLAEAVRTATRYHVELQQARARVDGAAWAALEADRDRYRAVLRRLVITTTVTGRLASPRHAEATVYLPDLDAARKTLEAMH